MSKMNLCQCEDHKSRECDKALYLNDRLSDLVITFPNHNISIPAHRLMMAKKSPYFENLFYGPMAIEKKEWKVKDNDIEPEIFKILLAHCYDLNLLEDNLEMTLRIYKLSDFYMIDSLKSQCLKHVCDIISKDSEGIKWNYQYINEWSKEYGFSDIEINVFECLFTKLCGSRDISETDQSFILNLPLETCKRLLSECLSIDILSFKESWRNPENTMSPEALMCISEIANHENEPSILQGCLSPEVVNKFFVTDGFYLSLIDALHSKDLYECFQNLEMLLGVNDTLALNLHIPYNTVPPNDLEMWVHAISGLYLSNIDDQSVQWAISSVSAIQPKFLYLPRSGLSMKGFKTLISNLVSNEVNLPKIHICSSNMKAGHKVVLEIDNWLDKNYGIIEKYNHYIIQFCLSDNEMSGW